MDRRGNLVSRRESRSAVARRDRREGSVRILVASVIPHPGCLDLETIRAAKPHRFMGPD
jgi:hypothetical protein